VRAAIILTFVGVLLAACARETRTISAPFEMSEYDQYKAAGTAEVRGMAYVIRPGSALAACGPTERVTAVPHTSWTLELTTLLAQRVPLQEIADPNLNSLTAAGITRITSCDQQGRFRFAALPAGRWIVAAVSGHQQQGGPPSPVSWTTALLHEGASCIIDLRLPPSEPSSSCP